MNRRLLLKSVLFAGCMLSLSVLPAAALEKNDFDFLTTEDLYMLCSADPAHGDFSSASYACRGFIAGAVQYHNGISDAKHLPRLICYPEGTTLKDGQVAFVQWAEKNKNNKELMNEYPVMGLVKALAEKYPCQKK